MQETEEFIKAQEHEYCYKDSKSDYYKDLKSNEYDDESFYYRNIAREECETGWNLGHKINKSKSKFSNINRHLNHKHK